MAHVDAGKTTLSEQLLLLGGAIRQAGRVDEGLATMDYLREEQRRGITIRAGLASFSWKGVRINFIDTPGHMDFGLEVERSLRALDAAIVVVCGVRGVEPRTRAIWSLCDRYDTPRVAWVNKLDVAGSDFPGTVLELEDVFGIPAVPVDWPFFHQGAFQGSVDLVSGRASLLVEGRMVRSEAIPPAWMPTVEPARERLLDQASRFDDELMQILLEEQTPSPTQIRRGLRRGIAQHKILPVCGGSALRGWNAEALLDQCALLIPPPRSPKGLEAHPGIGFVFKTSQEPGNPPVVLVRTIAGHFEVGDWIRKPGQSDRHPIQGMHIVFADRLDPILEVGPGDFAAMELDGPWRAGDTILIADGEDHVVRFEASLSTVLELAIEAENEPASNLIGPVLRKWADEDGAIEVLLEPATGRWLVRGQGELQLDILVSRLREEVGEIFQCGTPQVMHRERITRNTAPVEIQTIWEGRSFQLEVAVEPSGQKEIIWKSPVREGIQAAVEASIEKTSGDGVVGKGRLDAVRWELTVLRDELVPPWVAKQLLDHHGPEILRDAGAVAESPQVRVQVHTPLEHVGNITRELQTRGVAIQGVDTQRNGAIISALSPLERMLGCSKLLLSLSKGQANTTLMPGGWVAESVTSRDPSQKDISGSTTKGS
ncbi:MAG: GTP-binding protein [Fibrobacteria bacterium]|nr:GTP-binding protein [Fibrobacteria bacterium]